MIRFFAVAIAVTGFILGVNVVPASAQGRNKQPFLETPNVKASLDTMRRLAMPVPIGWLQTDEGEKFAKVVNVFTAKFKLLIDADDAAFAEEGKNIWDKMVRLPPGADTLPLHIVLERILSQVDSGNVTYLMRQGRIIIVPLRHATAAHLLHRPVLASFDTRPLNEVVFELSDMTSLTINIDPNVGELAVAPVNAMFRNCTLEDALLTATEMAKLKFVTFQSSIFITTPTNAKTIEKEEKERNAAREALQKARERLDK